MHGLSLRYIKKWVKEKSTCVEVGKLLKDSCRNEPVKIWSFRSKFQQCLCGQTGILFLGVKILSCESILGARNLCGKRLDFVESA